MKTNKKDEKTLSKADIRSIERICKYLLESEKNISNILSNIFNDFDSAKDLEDFDDKRRDPNNDFSKTIEMINKIQKYIARSRNKTNFMDFFKNTNNTNNKEIEKIKGYLEYKEDQSAIEQDCNALEDLDFVFYKLKQLDKNLGIDPNNEEVFILDESINEITQLFDNLERYYRLILALLKNASSDLEREKIIVEIEMAIDNVIKEVEKFIISSRRKSNAKNLKTNIEMHLSKIKVSFFHKYRELNVIKRRCKNLLKGYEASFINELRENIERIKDRRKLRYRLISLAQTTVSRQINMLARVGTIRTVSLHQNYKEQCLIRLYNTKGYKYKNEMEKNEKDKNLKPFTYSIDDIQPIDNQPFFFNPSAQKVHHYSVWIKIIDLQEDNVKIDVKVFRDHFKKRLFRKEFIYLYSELVETEAINFWISYFDMPYMDNTRLYDGSRFAITLKDLDLDNGYVLIQLASFREEFMSIRDRPLFEEMLMKIKDQQ